MGSGRVYKFLANKILAKNPTGLIQASSQYEGPKDRNSLDNWIPLNEYPGELIVGSDEIEILKNKQFSHIYFCVPELPETIVEEMFPAYTLVSALAMYTIPYICLLKEICVPNVVVHVFVDSEGSTFLQKVVSATLRPMLMEALANVPSKLVYTRTNSIIEERIEEWWAGFCQTHNLTGKDK